MEVASVAHENIKLQENIRKREETIQNLIYRYAQCEKRVRDFIKHTLRLIYHWLDSDLIEFRPNRIQTSASNDVYHYMIHIQITDFLYIWYIFTPTQKRFHRKT